MNDRASDRTTEASPRERELLTQMHSAYRALIDECGWSEAMYAPAGNHALELIEVGSTGIHNGGRDKDRSFWIFDEDSWPSSPILFRDPKAKPRPPKKPIPPEMAEAMERSMLGAAVVHFKAKAAGFGKGKGGDGNCRCPICENFIFYSVASINGHIHAKCKTPDCVSFME